ncbi:PREDICTED: uncharacterized protein LOC104592161 [Nelumbo nucifera]|uniref:Uncharacterized protein LOC104592161 n=1 Tax=Nelumbo nucifera TaxID=4432 RepID=A0A1U7Z8D6_NELNU|nr:PREDICTED: uncharacterized protein LOC104592161 [Nelumbo nucifera]
MPHFIEVDVHMCIKRTFVTFTAFIVEHWNPSLEINKRCLNPWKAVSKMSVPTILARLSTRSPSLVRKLYKNEISPAISSFKSSSQSQVSASAKRIYGTSRLPLELSSLVSMMPLHSAIASARLRSSLSIESQSWGLIPQGISMPL